MLKAVLTSAQELRTTVDSAKADIDEINGRRRSAEEAALAERLRLEAEAEAERLRLEEERRLAEEAER